MDGDEDLFGASGSGAIAADAILRRKDPSLLRQQTYSKEPKLPQLALEVARPQQA